MNRHSLKVTPEVTPRKKRSKKVTAWAVVNNTGSELYLFRRRWQARVFWSDIKILDQRRVPPYSIIELTGNITPIPKRKRL